MPQQNRQPKKSIKACRRKSTRGLIPSKYLLSVTDFISLGQIQTLLTKLIDNPNKIYSFRVKVSLNGQIIPHYIAMWFTPNEGFVWAESNPPPTNPKYGHYFEVYQTVKQEIERNNSNLLHFNEMYPSLFRRLTKEAENAASDGGRAGICTGFVEQIFKHYDQHAISFP